MTMTISLKQALLGFKKSVRQMDGRTIYLDSSEVVSPDQILVLKGEGMPKQIPSERGDLRVTMKITMPNSIDQGVRKVLQRHLPE